MFYRFGVFELDSRTAELRKGGRRLSLQGQPLQVLLLLLERPGELVERAEIQKRLWPHGTFVDFDHGLNAAVNKIRDALGDSAAHPRFIETLARRGYRFVGEVELVDSEKSPAAVAAPAPAFGEPRPEPVAAAGLLTSAGELSPAPRALVRTLFVLIQLMYLAFYVASLARFRDVQDLLDAYLPGASWPAVLAVVSALVGIPIRLYLISAMAFRPPGLRDKFLKIFPFLFVFDELWALAPFLLVAQIGTGLALGATAALLYVPFSERSLVLMPPASSPSAPAPAP